jgi:hypothetical protein
MASKSFKRYYALLIFLLVFSTSFGQNVPLGVFYQAVARDNYGKELVNKDIDVKFSIISGNPLGTLVYQELYSHVTTSKFGVFSLIIGHGTPTGGLYGELSQIQWNTAYHYLKVEVKFDNDFIDMGTMQFLAVPYALYAQKSLEPGPAGPKGDLGPKGDQGDPGADNQTLSFDGNNLSILNGNTINLSSLNVPHQLTLIGDTLSILGGNKVGLTNQIQDLQLDINNKLKITKNSSATLIDLSPFKQNLSYNNTTGLLSISNGTGADLSPLITAGIQDIHLTGNQLTIDKNPSSTGVDLSKYMDNTDNQQLTYTESSKSLSISGGNSVTLGTMVAFRAGITTSLNIPNNTPVDLIFDQLSGAYYNDGGSYNSGSGVFQAPFDGIYSFAVSINLPIGSSSVIIKLTGTNYETIIGPTSSGGYFRGNITLKLNKNDIINVAVVQNNGFTINPYIISGSFSGYRVY